MVIVQLFIDESLVLYVVGDHAFVAVFPDRAGEISVGPEFPAPQLFFDLGAVSEDFSCGNAFDHRDEFRDCVRGNALDEEMNMILIRADLEKVHLIPLFYLKACFLYDTVNLCVNDCPTVLCRKDDVVQENGDIVAFVDVSAHAYDYPTTDTPQGAGNMTLRE